MESSHPPHTASDHSAPTSSNTSSSAFPSTSHQRESQPAQVFSTSELYTDANANVPLKSAQYASSFDDPFGVQRNWFTALYKQLNYIAKTGQVKTIMGRQKEVFQQVESEFEHLYNKYVKDKPLQPGDHRSMLMCCLSVATYRILNDEIEDTRLVREIIRTNLGSMMISLLRPIHRFKLWVLRHILREDMYRQAVGLLPAMLQDMGGLVEHTVEGDDRETMLKVSKCAYHELLTQEETPFLLSEFCCHHGLLWMHEYRRHGVIVSMDNCKAWDDSCCQLRIARPGQQASTAAQGGSAEGARDSRS